MVGATQSVRAPTCSSVTARTTQLNPQLHFPMLRLESPGQVAAIFRPATPGGDSLYRQSCPTRARANIPAPLDRVIVSAIFARTNKTIARRNAELSRVVVQQNRHSSRS